MMKSLVLVVAIQVVSANAVVAQQPKAENSKAPVRRTRMPARPISVRDYRPTYYAMPKLDGREMPFSEAVRFGNTLYVSGQIGNMPGTLKLAPGGIEAESRQTMENIKSTLERNGSSLDRVIKCTVFLADMNDWAAFNRVYVEYFKKTLPARSALGANGLAFGAKVEVECIAVL